MHIPLLAAICAMTMTSSAAWAIQSTSATTTYRYLTVDGVRIFYREAGPSRAPTIVLLHGFPSSSREFDTLIPLLATRYHLVAPDFPGFGHSAARSQNANAYKEGLGPKSAGIAEYWNWA
jgi:pimeloyl-ACP methyl ester carboxylesterase